MIWKALAKPYRLVVVSRSNIDLLSMDSTRDGSRKSIIPSAKAATNFSNFEQNDQHHDLHHCCQYHFQYFQHHRQHILRIYPTSQQSRNSLLLNLSSLSLFLLLSLSFIRQDSSLNAAGNSGMFVGGIS